MFGIIGYWIFIYGVTVWKLSVWVCVYMRAFVGVFPDYHSSFQVEKKKQLERATAAASLHPGCGHLELLICYPAEWQAGMKGKGGLLCIKSYQYGTYSAQSEDERHGEKRQQVCGSSLFLGSGWVNHTKATTEKWTWLLMHVVWIIQIQPQNAKKFENVCLKVSVPVKYMHNVSRLQSRKW